MQSRFYSYTNYALSLEEVERLLNVAYTAEDRLLVLLATRYGFRREDIVKIRIRDINTGESPSITFYEAKKDRHRTIPIEPDVAKELARYLNTFSKIRVKKGFLFPFQSGMAAYNRLQNLCVVARIPAPTGRTGRPFHALRGTCVKLRQAQGWSVNEVAALIGDTPQTVMLHYGTVTAAELATKMQQPRTTNSTSGN
jgi:integrase